jgi:isopenicillin N synthase-like dioxygenase
MGSNIPIIDLSPYLTGDPVGTAALAAAVDQANRDTGFLVVTGHGVPVTLIDSMDAVTRAFFALPLEQKLTVRCAVPERSRGYMPPRSRALAKSLGGQSPPDLVEYFSIGQPEVPAGVPYFGQPAAGVNFWPNDWPQQATVLGQEFKATWTAYYQELERLARDLIRVFALALRLDENWFDPFVGRHCSNLFANHYPALTQRPEPGQLRLGAHTDYGSLTLLYQDATPGGLQISRDGVWVDAPHVPGAFIVNIGDLMARWTNDRWVSTLHRVQNPADGRYEVPRLSIPFFHQPDYDALIEAIPTCTGPGNPPKYAPITSGENMTYKTLSTLDGARADGASA